MFSPQSVELLQLKNLVERTLSHLAAMFVSQLTRRMRVIKLKATPRFTTLRTFYMFLSAFSLCVQILEKKVFG